MQKSSDKKEGTETGNRIEVKKEHLKISHEDHEKSLHESVGGRELLDYQKKLLGAILEKEQKKKGEGK